MAKVAVIGLDCATPQLVFGPWRRELPCLDGLMRRGIWGKLLSTHPPITVPAWTSMMTGRDPGELGLYGFRNRKNHTYDGYTLAHSGMVNSPRLWDLLGAAGGRALVLGVPQTYPPRAINGEMVACFLTPSTRAEYTYPASLKAEVERVAGGYVLDVEDFRTEDKAALLGRIYEKTRKHFRVATHLLETRPWDLFAMVEMGVDRIHHGFWSHMDPAHRRHTPANPYENAIRDYYRYVDGLIEECLRAMPPETIVAVVSDHGARALEGGVCLNEWLIQAGYLRLQGAVGGPTPIGRAPIDWKRTRAWGDGGYYGRLFLNVKGREPQGVIDPKDYERVRDDLVSAIEAIPDPQGRPLGSRVYRPEQLYRRVSGVAPDLLVYFGDLAWRSVGTVGLGSVHTFENDTGPDEANHDWQGIMILSTAGGSALPTRGEREGASIYDIAPTLLTIFGLGVSDEMIGKSLL